MGKWTVFTYLASPEFPEWQPSHRSFQPQSLLAPYQPYLLKQWNGGLRQTKRLFEEIVRQGYQGSYVTVARYTHRLRQDHRQQLDSLEGRGPAPSNITAGQPPLSTCVRRENG